MPILADVDRAEAFFRRVEGHRYLFHLFMLLAHGAPVSIDELAEAGGWPATDVRADLSSHPSTEWDEEGRIVGFGLTLRPTPHSFTYDGGTLYGWCASDALGFPPALGMAGTVRSTCPVTGVAITVEVTPDRVESVDPPEAVVTVLRPDAPIADVRAEACALGLFFASREVAAPWLEHNPDGQVNSVAYDFELAKQVLERIGWQAKT
jgi:alkylmercury lyase